MTFDRAQQDQWYSDMLYAAAARWGIDVPAGPDRPIIADEHAPLRGRLPVVEEMRWSEKDHRYHYVHIELILFTDRWSYALDVTGHHSGYAFGPRMKFCAPHPTRIDALRAAVDSIRRYLMAANDSILGLDAWLESILDPVQLALPGLV